jgi:hypothetical protein
VYIYNPSTLEAEDCGFDINLGYIVSIKQTKKSEKNPKKLYSQRTKQKQFK